jgi:hypothetical protein
MREKNAMARLNHPFIINLVSSYKVSNGIRVASFVTKGDSH